MISTNAEHHCGSSPYLYILICSRINNTDQRNAIRNTWGSSQHLKSLKHSVKINFMLGHNKQSYDKVSLYFKYSFNKIYVHTLLL